MSHSHIGSAWRPQPNTPLRWVERWTQEKTMLFSGRKRGARNLALQNVQPIGPGEVPTDPDLLITTADGKRFYLVFKNGNTFQTLDLPLLVWPADRGADAAFG